MLGARAASRQKRNSLTSNWDTTQAGSANDSVNLANHPFRSDGSFNCKIYWGDGTSDVITTYNQAETLHQYSSTGIYEIRIGGLISGWNFDNQVDDDKILDISNWGTGFLLINNRGNQAFEGCSNFDISARDAITIADSCSLMFSSTSLSNRGYINNWNTSGMTSCDRMFQSSEDFDMEISDWDVSNVSDFGQMFDNTKFNNGGSTGINGWNTSNATLMDQMFYRVPEFNQPIGNWDVSSVTTMENMLRGGENLNNSLNFGSFNQDLGNWDTSSVTSMRHLFSMQTGFTNGGSDSITGWNTSNVTNMNHMFWRNYDFNHPIGSWDMGKVTNVQNMFGYAFAFDQPIGNWNVSGVTNLNLLWGGSATATSNKNRGFNNGGSPDISGWDITSSTDLSFMFYGITGFNQPIGSWDTSNVVDMQDMFRGGENEGSSSNYGTFNQDLGNWDTSSVTDMDKMFLLQTGFNNGGSDSISGWNTSNVADMSKMFKNAFSFNQPIGSWDMGKVTTVSDMFVGNTIFNQDIGDWNITGITDINELFSTTESSNLAFNNGGSTGINNWDTSNVTDFTSMFYGMRGFNQPVGGWDVSNVTTMANMFRSAQTVSNSGIFNNGGNSNISGWNTAKVQNMSHLFAGLQNFNQPIGAWDTSSVTNITSMLAYCRAFDQDLSNWIVTGITSATNFMDNNIGALSTTNYDLLLSGWAQQSGDLQAGVSIDFGTSTYSVATGEQYKEILSGAGWTIIDGGSV